MPALNREGRGLVWGARLRRARDGSRAESSNSCGQPSQPGVLADRPAALQRHVHVERDGLQRQRGLLPGASAARAVFSARRTSGGRLVEVSTISSWMLCLKRYIAHLGVLAASSTKGA